MSEIPQGYHTVTPSLTVRDGVAALDFYAKAFGAVEVFRMPEPTGKIMHAEFNIGDSRIMLSDEYPHHGALAPAVGEGCSFMLYVTDIDAAFEQAIAAGATVVQAPTDMFWGDRSGKVNDPFGYRWTLASHVRDVSPEEMDEAAKTWAEQNQA
ncbi:VOC family protein [Luteolibacter flavescens]|uniref:VOC family protein n=1 Tax=Luteolibacter flavescens TaxID=1859460 RepID=A0ABT3FMP8_9BACT|nr:VOC family protein [Luteolibacter flavescens]MCW1884840.1 VOC family protein [Luteolibacter flavescens]